jgi:hypothetical protein
VHKCHVPCHKPHPTPSAPPNTLPHYSIFFRPTIYLSATFPLLLLDSTTFPLLPLNLPLLSLPDHFLSLLHLLICSRSSGTLPSGFSLYGRNQPPACHSHLSTNTRKFTIMLTLRPRPVSATSWMKSPPNSGKPCYSTHVCPKPNHVPRYL